MNHQAKPHSTDYNMMLFYLILGFFLGFLICIIVNKLKNNKSDGAMIIPMVDESSKSLYWYDKLDEN